LALRERDDKEANSKVTMALSPEEKEVCMAPVVIDSVDVKGNVIKIKRVIDRMTGQRKDNKKEKQYEYEVAWDGLGYEYNTWLLQEKLEKLGFKKHMKMVDEKVAQREGAYKRPLTQANVEKHLEDIGLDREYGTHHRMAALSGGQKVKVVLAHPCGTSRTCSSSTSPPTTLIASRWVLCPLPLRSSRAAW